MDRGNVSLTCNVLNMGNDTKLPILSTKTLLWLRCETKLLERRTPLTPAAAKKLIEAGLDVAVEEDPKRIFDIEEYKKCASPLLEPNPIFSDNSTFDLRPGSAVKSNPTIRGPMHPCQQ